MPLGVDFRLVKPIKKINDFNGKIEYVIPCTVTKIGKQIINNRYEIEIEHVDFISGEIVTNKGITYKKTIELFKDLKRIPPFQTTCNVVKINENTYRFIVYGLFNAGLIEMLYDVKGILNNDEQEIMNVFYSHYEELNNWVNGAMNTNSY